MLRNGTDQDSPVSAPLRAAARSYAEFGLRVLPLHAVAAGVCTCLRRGCPSAGKHPRTSRGVHNAAFDLVTIEDWWSRWPAANVGIATGTPLDHDRLLVLDIDPRNAGDATLQRLEWELGLLPRTAQVATGGDGAHFYVRVPLGVRPRATLGPGVDVKFVGGYVVAPPSIHASGGAYRWAKGRSPWETTPAPLPTTWLTAMRRHRAEAQTERRPAVVSFSSSERETRARRYARRVPGAIAGQRGHDATFVAAAKIARGFELDAETAFSVLWEEWNPRCDPPWDERDLHRKIEQALERGDLPLGSMLERCGEYPR